MHPYGIYQTQVKYNQFYRYVKLEKLLGGNKMAM